MEELIGIVAVTLIFGGGGLFLLSLSPVGRAVADRIRGKGVGLGDERIRDLLDGHDAMLDEMETMRTDVADLQERLDFTERLLTKGRAEELHSSEDVKN